MAQTIKVPHTIELVTEFDTAHPMTSRLMSLPDGVLSRMLVETFVGLMEEEGIMAKLNENNTYATLKFAKDVEDDSSK
jgi:hypothetical protein